jgi:hypothetical protein
LIVLAVVAGLQLYGRLDYQNKLAEARFTIAKEHHWNPRKLTQEQRASIQHEAEEAVADDEQASAQASADLRDYSGNDAL